MDIFYYWQRLEQDLKTGDVGYFGSNNTKIVELAERLPKRMWVFKTPKGMKGSIQLVGSLLISDGPRVATKTAYTNIIYYDPFSPESVMFTDSDTPERIQEISEFFQFRFRSAFNSNFQRDASLQAMESNVVRSLEALVADWGKCQMLERVKAREKVQPINPFAK